MSEGLVAYCPFNSNANDESGNGNHGEVSGATIDADRYGNESQAYSFDGSNDYISASGDFPQGSSPRSLTFWARPTKTTGSENIVGWGQSAQGKAFGAYAAHDEGRNGIYFYGHRVDFSAKFAVNSKWHQYSIIHNGQLILFFVDGNETARHSAQNINTTGNSLIIGARIDLEHPFTGPIDDIRIYSRALSAGEVKSLYEYESTPPAKRATGILPPPAEETVVSKTRPSDIAATTKSTVNPRLAVKRGPNVPPDGFTALFNGKDLTGWKGLVGNPKTRAKMAAGQLAESQKKADNNMRAHWSVQKGVLVFDGKGQSLCTVKDYGDFELYVDWKIEPKGDSGIYLRGSPQVQICDPKDGPRHVAGSGGLYNNKKNSSNPQVRADNPIRQWNTFYIKMVGERVTVRLNGQLVVDNVVFENYWEGDKPIYSTGAIELQNHGSTLYFRNLFLRSNHGAKR